MKTLVLIFVTVTNVLAQSVNFPVFSVQQQQQQFVPVIGPLGVPLDTREVQAARATHFDIFNRQRASAQYNRNQLQNEGQRQFGNQFVTSGLILNQNNGAPIAFNQQSQLIATNIINPNNQPQVAANIYLQDTPEVSAAKAQHFQIYARQAALAALANKTSLQNGEIRFTPVYNFLGLPQLVRQRRGLGDYGREAIQHTQHVPVIGKNEVPIDTHEVQWARAKHLMAHHAVKNEEEHQIDTHGPIAFRNHNNFHEHVPVIGPKGVPVDTPEVQIARAQHFAAHAEIKARKDKKYAHVQVHHEHQYEPEPHGEYNNEIIHPQHYRREGQQHYYYQQPHHHHHHQQKPHHHQQKPHHHHHHHHHQQKPHHHHQQEKSYYNEEQSSHYEEQLQHLEEPQRSEERNY